MALVALSALRSRAQTRADMANSSFVSAAEWNQFLNDSCAELYDLLVAAFEDYFTTSANVTTVAGTETYALPSDYYKTIGLDWLDTSSGDWVTLKPFTVRSRNLYRNATTTAMSVPRYWLKAGFLHLLPIPSDARSVKHWYIPQMPALSGDASTFDGVNGWEEYAVVDAAIKALLKEESDVSALMAQKEGLRQRIIDMAASRDAGTPKQIVDVYSTDLLEEL